MIYELCRVVPDYQDITRSDCMVCDDQMNWQICIGRENAAVSVRAYTAFVDS